VVRVKALLQGNRISKISGNRNTISKINKEIKIRKPLKRELRLMKARKNQYLPQLLRIRRIQEVELSRIYLLRTYSSFQAMTLMLLNQGY